VTYSDPAPSAGLNLGSFSAILDGQVLSGSFTVNAGEARFLPTAPLSEGTRILAVQIADAATNSVTATATFTIDSVAPDLTLFPADGDLLGGATSTFTASYSDPAPSSGLDLGSFQAFVDGQEVSASFDVQANQATFTPVAALADGSHQFQALIRDSVWNVRNITVEFVVDSTDPVVTLTPAGGSFLNDSTPTLVVAFSDASPSSGIDQATFAALLDGVDVSASFVLSAGLATYTPSSPLAEGTRVLVVRIQDQAGNSVESTSNFFVDTIEPQIQSDVADGAILATGTPGFTMTFSDAAPSSGLITSSFAADLDGVDLTASFVVGTNQATFTPSSPLIDGDHTLTVSIEDGSGNVSIRSLTFSVDTATPQLSLAPVDGARLNSGQPSLVATFTDVGSGVDEGSFQALLDGQDISGQFDVQAGQATYQPTDLESGSHALIVRIRDLAGNEKEATSSFVIDSVAPTVSILPADSSIIADGNVTFTVQYEDTDPSSGLDLGSFTAALNGQDVTASFAVAAGDATWTVSSPIADGPGTLTVSIADQVGNMTSVTNEFTIDSIAPLLAISPADGSLLDSSTQTILVSYTDSAPGSGLDLASFQAVVNGQDVSASFSVDASSASFEMTDLPEGNSMIAVQIGDQAGNITAQASTVTVDSVSPVLASSIPNGAAIPSATPVLTISFTDASPSSGLVLASFTVTLDGQDISGQFTVQGDQATGTLQTPLAEGSHVLVYSISDQIGNSSQLEVNVIVDSIPPTLLVTPGEGSIAEPQPEFVVMWTDPDPSSGVDTNTLTATFNGLDVAAEFTVFPTEARFTPVQPLAIGSHILVVAVRDTAGNAVEATRTVGLADGVSPVVSLTPAAGSSLGDSRPTLSATFADADPSSGIATGTFQATLDGNDVTGNFAVSSSAASWSPSTELSQGEHLLEISIQDQSGNPGSSSSTFTVDTVIPFLTSSISPDAILTVATPNLVATFADPPPGVGLDLATFVAILDGQDVSERFDVGSIQASYRVSPTAALQEGTHNLTYRISDQALNSAELSFSFLVDTGPPQISIVSPSDGTQIPDGEPLFEIQYSDSGAGLDLASLSITLNGVDRTSEFTVLEQGAQLQLDASNALATGAYTLDVNISDNAGSTAQVTSAFTYPGPDDGSSPTLSLVGIENQVFSPAPNPYVDPDDLKTKILIRYDQPATTLVTVKNSAGDPMRALILPLSFSGESVTVAWDGRDDQGRLVIDSAYNLEIQGSNLFGRSSNSKTVEVRLFY